MNEENDFKAHALWADPNFDILIKVKKILDSSRIWNGMDWSYGAIHPVKYLPLREQVDAELIKLKKQYGVEE